MSPVPGPSYPSIVQTLLYLARPEDYLADCHRRYGDVFKLTTVVFGPEVVVVRPEEIKKVFTGDPHDLRAGEANVALQPLVGARSVLLLDGAEHLRQRRLLTPPFHGERMALYGKIMREITERAVDRWLRAAGDDDAGSSLKRETRVLMHAEMQKITLEVILRAVFGVEEGARLDDLRAAMLRLLEELAKPFSMFASVPQLQRELFGFSPWARFDRSIKRVDALIYEEIRRRRADAIRREDVMSLLLDARDEDGQPMTDVELRDELMTLLAAGHETTATELSWAFDTVLRNPRVLHRLRQEIDGAGEGAPLPYLDATIKECLRLHPVVPAVARRLKKDTVVRGHEVRAGTLLVPAVWLTHRQPDLYPDPETLLPERFLRRKPDPYEFFPFGGGVRRCIGMAFAMLEMRVVLSAILSRLDLRVEGPKPARAILRGFTHAPRGGVPVLLRERSRTRTTQPPKEEARISATESYGPN